eukprot:TRINITY_DN9062_c1_g2_i3.p1 TRINITY_DN9062_c1_g2~~TRINITY_DN9062_c1_g2_i3.p1  ORF type:complete len:164 (+),score=19.63 TRINITY_DN9062_c1_g2_i3:1126-1617(+)
MKVIGYPPASNAFIFDRNLNYKLFNVIVFYNDQKPALVFCNTRKTCVNAAAQLLKDAGQTFIKDSEHKMRLFQASQKTSNKSLSDAIRGGIGFHHAGMDRSDRNLVAELFSCEDLMVLVATSSLSQGVNFPAHLVVIKGTQMYKSGLGYVEYNENQLQQMIGY